ncbi:MAG: radical SAM protein [Nitrosomonas sp.]|nr:radical SAM protein [Nitrosomonas sp.]
MGPTGLSRVLQIHPTRQCNLRCLHCYSSSSPDEKEFLTLELLCDAISDAAHEGFNYVSLSGGEPMLYKPLTELLEHAHRLGMRTAVTTNGMLLTERKIERLRDVVDVLAISIDGVPASHNRIRGSQLAFDTMKLRLPLLRAADMPFGFIFTLTQYNLDEFDWVRDFAAGEGAKLLQIHPLEEVGNAATMLRGNSPDATEGAYAWMLAQQEVDSDIRIHVDLAFSEVIKQQPELVFAGDVSGAEGKRFGELIAPLVIEADGTVSPVQHGFSRDYTMGNLKHAPLSVLVAEWRKRSLPAFYSLCRDVYEEIACAPAPFFFDWNNLIGRRAEEASRVTRNRAMHFMSM